jgi:hypothetical protein
VERWDKTYVAALDSGDLEEFEDEADSIEARRALAEQLGQIETAAKAATSTVTPAEQLAQARTKRAAEDKANKELAKTPEGLKELARRAKFGGPVKSIPLTGTGRHFPL